MTVDTDDSLRLRVLIDASKVIRCKWCGTHQSDDWKITDSGAYCSKKCFTAVNSTDIDLTVIVILLGAFVSMFLVVSPLSTELYALGILGLPISILLLWYYVSGYFEDEEYKQEVPRNSRQGEGSIDASLLRTIGSSISCPKCDGAVDISHLEDDLVYYCDYCGASGLIEIIFMNQ